MSNNKNTPYSNFFNEQKELELTQIKEGLKLEKLTILKSLLEASMVDESTGYPLEQRFKPVMSDIEQEEIRNKIIEIVRTL